MIYELSKATKLALGEFNLPDELTHHRVLSGMIKAVCDFYKFNPAQFPAQISGKLCSNVQFIIEQNNTELITESYSCYQELACYLNELCALRYTLFAKLDTDTRRVIMNEAIKLLNCIYSELYELQDKFLQVYPDKLPYQDI